MTIKKVITPSWSAEQRRRFVRREGLRPFWPLDAQLLQRHEEGIYGKHRHKLLWERHPPNEFGELSLLRHRAWRAYLRPDRYAPTSWLDKRGRSLRAQRLMRKSRSNP